VEQKTGVIPKGRGMNMDKMKVMAMVKLELKANKKLSPR
jgi:hypothetical protein